MGGDRRSKWQRCSMIDRDLQPMVVFAAEFEGKKRRKDQSIKAYVSEASPETLSMSALRLRTRTRHDAVQRAANVLMSPR